LRQVFGITHTRFEAAKMDDDAFENLLDTVNSAFRDSESLLDYAGRMRIPNSGYVKLRESWIKNFRAGKSTLSYGHDLYDMVKTLVQRPFIYRYP